MKFEYTIHNILNNFKNDLISGILISISCNKIKNRKYQNFYKISFLILLFFTSNLARSQDQNEKMIIPRIPEEITLDGIIDEPAWKQAKELHLIQTQPNFGELPSEKTEVFVGYTENYFYAACKCYDRQKPLAASYRRDYTGADTDWFEIILDTYNDNENVTVYATSPTGSRTDATVSNDAIGDSPLDLGWNNFWDVEVTQNETGWFVEMRIPVSSLRFQKKEGQVIMGMTVLRIMARHNEYASYPPIPPNWPLSFMKASQAQDIMFQELNPNKLLRISPYVLAGFGQENLLNKTQNNYDLSTDYTYDAGLDVKYGLTSNLTLDLTVNTDFAQVEADNQQVNITRFPLFFPEKREFFLQRASNFAFTFGGFNRLFYSRRIGLREGERVPILGGARLVGRQGPWDIGFLVMQTGRGETISGDELASENLSVLRLRRQVINPFSYVGGIITSRIGANGDYNMAYGLDGIFRLFGNDYFSIKWAQTFDDSFTNEFASLDSARLQLQWERRTYSGIIYNFQYDRAGENYKPELGFEFRENYYRLGNNIGYGWIPGQNSVLQRYHISAEGEAYFSNFDGSVQTISFGPVAEFFFNSGHSIMIGGRHITEDVIQPFFLSKDVIIPAEKYSFQQGRFIYRMPASWPFRSSVELISGGYFNGYLNSLGFNPVWNASSKLRIEGNYEYNDITFSEEETHFISHIGRVKLELTPNTKLSFMAFIQYNSVAEGLAGNVRMRYTPRDGNDFYLVYNENLNTNPRNYLPVLPLSQNRAVIVKYTHTFHNF